jgi:hypothetical protein
MTLYVFLGRRIRKSEDNKNEENGKEVLHGKQQKRRKCGSD